MSAFAVAPAMANVHFPAGKVPNGNTKSFGLAIHQGHSWVFLPGGFHAKTNLGKGPKKHKYTYIDTLANYTLSASRATWYKQTHSSLGGEVWYSESCVYNSVSGIYTCHVYNAPGQTQKASKDSNAKIKSHVAATLHNSLHTVTTYYGGRERFYTTLTYFGPTYDLKNNSIASDSFNFNDNLVYNFTYTNTCGKQQYITTDTARLNYKIDFH